MQVVKRMVVVISKIEAVWWVLEPLNHFWTVELLSVETYWHRCILLISPVIGSVELCAVYCCVLSM